jgi:hypothetical protein
LSTRLTPTAECRVAKAGKVELKENKTKQEKRKEMRYLQIPVYEFKELNEKAKRRAIEDQRQFACDTFCYDSDQELSADDQWEEINTDEYLIDSIEINHYEFFEDGKFCSFSHTDNKVLSA